MKAVMAHVPEHVLEQRRRTGADRWDEMWEGVLHMPPMPSREHQDLEGELEMWLRIHWAQPRGNKVYHNINLASIDGWPDHDYRIPDLVLLTPDRFHIDHNEYFEGAPTVVVEIRSPDDETYEKLPFYAKLGVSEVWVIDRDTRMPEVYILRGTRYQQQEPDAEAWLPSPATDIQLRHVSPNKLELRIAEDERTRKTIPPD